jgi:hypothetical protein
MQIFRQKVIDLKFQNVYQIMTRIRKILEAPFFNPTFGVDVIIYELASESGGFQVDAISV